MRLDGKVVVVTGASMGIGEAIAKVFAQQGAQVVMSSRDLGRLEEARQRVGFPDRTVSLTCDVADPEQSAALLRQTIERFGRIDIWVNNAGFGLVDSSSKWTWLPVDECSIPT